MVRMKTTSRTDGFLLQTKELLDTISVNKSGWLFKTVVSRRQKEDSRSLLWSAFDRALLMDLELRPFWEHENDTKQHVRRFVDRRHRSVCSGCTT